MIGLKDDCKIGVDREEYEDDLRRRQKEHFEKIKNKQGKFTPCLHEKCTGCHGTGIKLDRSKCNHFISCPCPKCNRAHF